MARTLTLAVAARSPLLVTTPVRLPAFAPAGSELIDVTPTPAACAAGASASTASAAADAPAARLTCMKFDPLVATREGPSLARARGSVNRAAVDLAQRRRAFRDYGVVVLSV